MKKRKRQRQNKQTILNKITLKSLIEKQIKKNDIRTIFPKNLSFTPTLSNKKIDKNRVDLTKIPFITIDGEDSKDFDDAIYAKKKRKIF